MTFQGLTVVKARWEAEIEFLEMVFVFIIAFRSDSGGRQRRFRSVELPLSFLWNVVLLT